MARRRPYSGGLVPGFLLGVLLACNSNPEAQRQRLLSLGDDHFQRKQYEEASILYRKAILVDRRFAPAYYRLGLADQELGRRGGAAEAFLRAFELDPDNLDAFRQLAELHFVSLASPTPVNRQATLDSLISLHRQAEQRHPDTPEVLLVKGQIMAYQGAAEEALSLFRRVYQRMPADTAAVLGLSASLVQNGLPDEARSIAEKLLAHDPTAGPAYDFLYLLHARHGRREAAEAVLGAKCRNIPENTGNWISLASHYRAMGKEKEADGIVQRLLADTKRHPDARRLAGDYYLRFGHTETALQLYCLGSEEDAGKQKEYHYGIVRAQLSKGDFAAAALEVDRLLAADPDDAPAIGLRGLLRLHRGRPEELAGAAQDLKASLAAQPENYVLRYHYGQALFAGADPANAEREFRESLRTNQDFLPARHALVELLLSRGEYIPAEREAKEILAEFPFDPRARLGAAEAYLGLQRHQQARRELEQLPAAGLYGRRAGFLLAKADLAEGRTGEAARGFRALLDATPVDMDALRALVELELSQGRPQAALDCVRQALAREPSNVDLRLAAGRLSMTLKREAEAAALLEEVVKEHPRHGPAHAYLAELRERQGNHEAARKHLREAMQAQPPVPVAFLAFGAALAARRKYEEARPYLERAVELAPESAAARNKLASVLAELGSDLDTALNHAERAVAREPDNSDFADTLACVYLRRRLYPDAITILGKIVARHPDRGDYQYHLGLALYESGELTGARRHLSAAQGERLSETQRVHVRRLLSEIMQASATPRLSTSPGGRRP